MVSQPTIWSNFYQFSPAEWGVPPKLIQLLLLYGVILIISLLVWQISRHLSRRSVFKFDISKYEDKSASSKINRIANFLLYILKYAILFPVYTVFWGALFVFFLLVLIPAPDYENILFFSAAIIAVIRTVAYINEEYAENLALLLPLWLLITILIDPSVLSKISLYINFGALLRENSLILSIGFIVMVEWLLRLVYGIHELRRARQLRDK